MLAYHSAMRCEHSKSPVDDIKNEVASCQRLDCGERNSSMSRIFYPVCVDESYFYFECPRLIYLRGNQGNVTTAACGKFKCGVYLYDFNLDEYLIGPLW